MAKLLSESIGQIVRKSIGKGNKIVSEIIINWHKVVGDEIANSSSPTNIYSTKEKGQQINILYVNVTSSAVGLKISYSQEMIAEKIAIYFGYRAVHKIRTKVVS